MSATNEQLEEAWSWIHNERRCVTVQTVSLSMGMSRSDASLLLAQLPSFKPGDYSYECTKCVLTQKDDKTVMKLQKSVVSGNDMDTSDNTTSSVYSLALLDTESVHTAHEKDMAQFRNALKEEDSPQATATTMALEPTLHQQTIANPNFGNTRMTAHASQQERLSGRVVAGAAAAMPALTAARMSSSSKPAARKATTAANFFGSNATKKDSKKPAAKKPPTAKKPPAAKKPAAAAKKPPKATRAEPEEMDVDHDNDGATNNSSSRGEEKENSVNKTKSVVGNVDDFVGDVDSEDDEEFQESEKERKRRNEARDKKQRKKKEKQPVQQDYEEEEDPPVKVHGAMDAFAQHVEKKPEQEPRKTKRRKRLVEKTTVDANGYMHTETQAVWEDVEEEEEEPAAASKPAPVKKKAASKNTKNMKQGSLMGFFKKK